MNIHKQEILVTTVLEWVGGGGKARDKLLLLQHHSRFYHKA